MKNISASKVENSTFFFSLYKLKATPWSLRNFKFMDVFKFIYFNIYNPFRFIACLSYDSTETALSGV